MQNGFADTCITAEKKANDERNEINT